MTKITVTSGDFLKSYGRIIDTAMREPVSITSHGRERLVLLAADEYRRLKALDRKAVYPWELGSDALLALEAAEPPPAAEDFDHEVTAT